MPSFSLITLNCYGVPAPGTASRLRALAEQLNQAAPSVICLQEVQTHAYRRLLTIATRGHPASAYEPFIHAPKGGLLTLSAPPIDRAEFVLYRERGLWYTPALADWILHKGVLVARLTVDGLPVIVLNTHLTANYLGDWSERSPFARQEHEQLQQLAELVRRQPDDALVIVCGDFNIPRGSWMYRAFIEAAGLHDPLAEDTRPTLRPRSALPRRFVAAIDYALVRAPAALPLRASSDLCFDKRVTHNGRVLHLSDHLGVELRLTWESTDPSSPPSANAARQA